MLSRRSLAAALGGWCVVGTCASRTFATGPMPKTPVVFEVPRGACDTHVHVIGEPDKFPMSAGRDSTPPPATADDLGEMLRLLHFDRVVIVTPDVYDTGNSATLDAIRRLGRARARGVAWVAENTPTDVLDRMSGAGIAGIRVSLSQDGSFQAATAVKRLHAQFELAKQHGWHVETGPPPDVVAALAGELASSPVPVVLHTFGWVEGGIEQSGFDAILSLVKSGHVYVKLSEPYRLSKKGPDYPDLMPVVRALVAANPDRLLWGSGWPYLSGPVPGRAKYDLAPALPIDAGHLLNLFSQWVPDAETRYKILVDNPAQLYGF